MSFIWCSKFPSPGTPPTGLTVAHFVVLLQRALTAHFDNHVCFEIYAMERPWLCSKTALSLVSVLALAMMYDLRQGCLPQPDLYCRVWLFLSEL